MTYYADLTPYAYLADAPGPALNVGWLAGHDHPRGPVPEGFAEALAELVVSGLVNLTRRSSRRFWVAAPLRPESPSPGAGVSTVPQKKLCPRRKLCPDETRALTTLEKGRAPIACHGGSGR
jgi:hypothetical protein